TRTETEVARYDRNRRYQEHGLNHPAASEGKGITAIRTRLIDSQEDIHQSNRCEKPNQRPRACEPLRKQQAKEEIQQSRKQKPKVGSKADRQGDSAAEHREEKDEDRLAKCRQQEGDGETREDDEKIATRDNHVV